MNCRNLPALGQCWKCFPQRLSVNANDACWQQLHANMNKRRSDSCSNKSTAARYLCQALTCTRCSVPTCSVFTLFITLLPVVLSALSTIRQTLTPSPSCASCTLFAISSSPCFALVSIQHTIFFSAFDTSVFFSSAPQEFGWQAHMWL